MKLNKIIIKNFRSYYGENCFELSDGLTLVIGDNGDGKTTFFEALEWLFDTSKDNKSESNISEMRKAEMGIGDSDEVSVTMTFDHRGEKEICKKFIFEKDTNGSVRTRDFSFVGYEIVGAERYKRDGKILLESCFDTVIRRYCLFKGERELNVFDNNTALKTLVDTFSGIKQFDNLVELTTYFEQQSDNLVTKELKKDKKQEEVIKRLEYELSKVQSDISDVRHDISIKEKAVSDYETRLRVLEENQDACENLQDINARIEQKKIEQRRLMGYINLDYNAMLLDDMWILRAFPSILSEYQKKVSSLSREKRKLQKAEDERIAVEKGKQEAIKEIQKLANDATPLPWNLPDKETMQEMIDDEICKVCGRPAEKGSDAYNFMVNKLNEYLDHIRKESEAAQQQETPIKPLFENTYINELHTRSIQLSGDTEQELMGLATAIADRLSFVQSRKQDLERVNKDLTEAEDAKMQLLIQTPDLTEEMLIKNFKDFKGLSDSSKRASLDLQELNHELEVLEAQKQELKERQNQIVPSNGIVRVYQKVHITLERIMKAFEAAKNRNVEEFIQTLEEQANIYLKKLNADDFRGVIKIKRTADGSARINLYSSNDTLIANPGGAQKTTMYMSVLFAISKITTLKRDEDYPLIFDAPTSSFGEFKEDIFYNIIDNIDKQCVIFTKDLLRYDRDTEKRELDFDKINQLSCSVYRIQKAPGYDEEDLSTIRTITERIK
ncbi:MULTISPECIES: AAA family ATPase [Bacteroidaceae]|uniref:AAA family ATPase n=1 Tax=Bacteroidaceae TaxID=815 RepID=UPI0020132FA7|nr:MULTISPECIES: AAA family ATPase [Bacteroidaceae]MCL1606460.1 AAA family ATPase [Mediterranea sp. ET5]MDM8123837.1 AAA family ATPase [Mediterranea massiliensis]MDM8196962.1 AAA family ATPase [Mediterranea massiliensis]